MSRHQLQLAMMTVVLAATVVPPNAQASVPADSAVPGVDLASAALIRCPDYKWTFDIKVSGLYCSDANKLMRWAFMRPGKGFRVYGWECSNRHPNRVREVERWFCGPIQGAVLRPVGSGYGRLKFKARISLD